MNEEESKQRNAADIDVRYRYVIDPNGDSTANKVLKMVPRGSRVLEIGCGPGSMTQYMAEVLDCRVTAVEIDSQLAELAKPYCEQLIVADVQALSFDEPPFVGSFDAIVAADVLEHLVDPWRCLRALRSSLSAEGVLVVSIPNISHNVVLAQLLAGRFQYQPQGLLDATHLRFFSRHDVEELLLSGGFFPARWDRNQVHPEKTEFATFWKSAPESLRHVLSHNDEGETYQFIVQAYRDDQAGLIAQARVENRELSAELEQVKATAEHLQSELSEYQKAFSEARDIIAEKEKKLTEVHSVYADASKQLSARDKELDLANRAILEAREALNRSASEKNVLAEQIAALNADITHLRGLRSSIWQKIRGRIARLVEPN